MRAQMFAATTILSLIALPAPAQTTHDPAAVQGGAYVVEPDHTRILFDVDHLGFTRYFGEFSHASGRLMLDPKNPAASKVTISIPTASIWTPSDKLNEELKSAQWLDATASPTITFVSTKVTPTGPATAEIAGDLTVHGVTRPVVLDARFHGAGVFAKMPRYTIGFDASAHLKRSDFGVNMGVPFVGDDVEVIISAAFLKAD